MNPDILFVNARALVFLAGAPGRDHGERFIVLALK
jgi:hypothetical protein